MNVQDEFLRLKKAWMAAHGEEREQLDKQMDEFFASLDEQQQAEVREAVDSDFSISADRWTKPTNWLVG